MEFVLGIVPCRIPARPLKAEESLTGLSILLIHIGGNIPTPQETVRTEACVHAK